MAKFFLTLSFSNDPDSSTSKAIPSHSKTAVSAIVGGTIASVILLLIISTVLFIYCCRRRRTACPNTSGIVRLDNMPTATLSGPPSQFVIPPSTQQLVGRASYPDFAVPLQSSGISSLQQLLQVNDSGLNLRKEEMSHQLEDCQQELVQTSSSPLSMSRTAVDTIHIGSDSVLESQVEGLKREVTELDEMLES
jgi:hypothetical protein